MIQATLPVELPPVIGHRGLAAIRPENTLSSFKAAKDHEIPWVEFDVMLSRDNIPIIFHDWTLNRTTNKCGPVSDVVWDNLSCYDAGSWFDPAYSQERIPSLIQGLQACQRWELNINIELKPIPGQAIPTTRHAVETLLESNFTNSQQVLISSYSIEALAECQRIAPHLPRGLLFDHHHMEIHDLLTELEVLGCISFHCELERITPTLIETLKRERYLILVHTVNEQSRAEQLWSQGVDSVFSNYPLLRSQ